jgi:hypothetical protein
MSFLLADSLSVNLQILNDLKNPGASSVTGTANAELFWEKL